MSVIPSRYQPPQASERLLPKVNGFWTQCAVSSTWTSYALATAGESTLTRTGKVKDRKQRRAEMMRMWKATGDTTLPAFNQSHVPAMLAALGDRERPERFNVSWERAMEALDQGYVLSLAVRLRQAPASSPLRKHTSADHQVTVRPFDRDEVRVIDPMAPQGTEDTVRVPKSHLRAAAVVNDPNWNPNGVIAFRYPLGGWTAARLQTASLRTDLRQAKSRNTRLLGRLANKDATIDTQKARIRELEAGGGLDCSGAVAAEHERTLVAAIEALEGMRS